MSGTEATLLNTAMAVSGGFLYGVTTVVLVFGLLVVALSLRSSQSK